MEWMEKQNGRRLTVRGGVGDIQHAEPDGKQRDGDRNEGRLPLVDGREEDPECTTTSSQNKGMPSPL